MNNNTMANLSINHTNQFTSIRTLIGFTLAVLYCVFSYAVSAAEPKLAISGYSPVSYFTEGKPQMGSAEFAAVHQDKRYYFTSAEQVELFMQNPEKYRPRHDVCPYSLALGKVKPIDPTNFKIIAGTLLLFHKSDTEDGLQAFENSGLSEQELIERADLQFKLLF